MRVLGRLCLFCCALSALFLSGSAFAASAQSSSTTGVQAMKLVQNNSGWLLANRRLFWTDSLGSQWTEITPTVQQPSAIDGVFFSPDGNGWALEATPDGSNLTVAHTGDKGTHWTYSPIVSPFTEASAFGGKANLDFVDSQHGWMMLSLQSGSAFRLGLLLQTSDGGAHWTQEPTPPVGGDLDFIDTLHGWMGPGPAGDELFRTDDGGQSWTAATLPPFSASLKSVSSTVSLPTFSDALHGTLLRTYNGDQGTTVVQYQTTDGGETWTPATTPVQAAATPSIVSIASDGTVTSRITAVPSHADIAAITPAAVGKVVPVRSSFSTDSQGWVLFAGGNCQAGTCTQTSALMGTKDGGKTFFSLGKIPGVNLQPTSSFTKPGSTAPQNRSSPSGIQPQSSFPTTGPAGAANPGVMGFDACTLPTTTQMSTWHTSSPYDVVGVYIGGTNFACKSGLGSLTSTYVSTILGQGWVIEPLWVGLQSPNSCSGCTAMSTTPATAKQQGATEADSAVAAMAALGLGQGSSIVYDMEAYSRTTTNVAATQAFLEGWTTELHAKGYLSSVYSSHPEFTDWYPNVVTPPIDIIWFAYFFDSGVACGTECQTVFPTQTSFDISSSYWLDNHRARQTSSGFEQTYGGVQIDIDEDWVDASMVVNTPNTLTVNKTGNGSVASTQISNGTDSTIDTAISCGDGCTTAHANFAATDILTLVATPDSGSTFTSWTGCTSTSGTTCTVNVTAATTVSAAFSAAVINYTLTVTKTGTGTGTVTSGDSTIACGSTCSASYTSGTAVTLTAVPATGSTFASWTGCTSTSDATCTVTVSAATTVSATFNTAAAPTFSAAPSSSSLSIVSGQSGSETLTITPQSGYTGTFSSFSCTGLPSSASCTFSPTTLTATGNGAALTTTVTIATAATTGQVVTSHSTVLFAGLLLPSLLLPFALRRKLAGNRTRKLLLLIVAVAALGVTPFLTGCGGSSSPSTPTGPVFSGTINVNFTASAGGGSTQVPIQLTITR